MPLEKPPGDQRDQAADARRPPRLGSATDVIRRVGRALARTGQRASRFLRMPNSLAQNIGRNSHSRHGRTLVLGRVANLPRQLAALLVRVRELASITVRKSASPAQAPTRKAAAILTADTHVESSAGAEARREHEVLLRAMASLATAIWRIKSKIDASPELPSALRHLPRHVQAALDAMRAAEIEIWDPTGQRYVPGMAVRPIAFQPIEGMNTETIHETIKPSVVYKGEFIQRADVIVAQPIAAQNASQPDPQAGPDEEDSVSRPRARESPGEPRGSTCPETEEP